jgi:hypothetical protein
MIDSNLIHSAMIDTREEADAADPYRYTRQFIPGGRLPWERHFIDKG